MVRRDAVNFCKLFIGGLDYRTEVESLQEYFGTYGDIVDAVVMKDPVSKRSRGFGFCTFADPSSIDDVQENRPHRVDERIVETKRAVPREEGSEANSSVKKIFVSGIKDELSEDDVRDHFQKYGNVMEVTFVTDKDSGRRRGFGFVVYDDYDAADKAILHKDDHMVKGKYLGVKKAVSKDQMSSMNRGGPPPRGGRGGYGGGGYGGPGPWDNGRDYSNGGGPWGGAHNAYGDAYGDSYGDGGRPYGGGYGGGGPMRNYNQGGSRNAPYNSGGGGGGYGRRF